MGNIVTPDQGLLPLPDSGVTIGSAYPWWLNTALAIWALLALLCCWLLLLLYLLRYCCRWCRHRKYTADRMSLKERLFGGKNRYIATAPSLPPIVPYAMNDRNEVTFHDAYESQSVRDDLYGDTASAYVTSAAVDADNEAFESSSELISEEEIASRGISKKPKIIRTLANRGVTENLEKNVHRNITKNFYVNEEQNYFIQKDPLTETSTRLHDQEVQRLPGPTVTTVNMAAERLTDNPNWENVNAKENFVNQDVQKASSKLVPDDPGLFQQDVKYEKQPDIYIHRPLTPPVIPIVENRKIRGEPAIIFDDASETSEMSGHDSESIYETIRVLTPKPPSRVVAIDDEDDHKTAGVDEVEIEIQDLVRLQQNTVQMNETYHDIFSPTYITRNNPRSRMSSVSSSSTLNNLMSLNSALNQPDILSREEKKEETVTETIQTRQIQSNFQQTGDHLGKSAFSIPMRSSITNYQGHTDNEQQIIMPVMTSIITKNGNNASRNI